jgi:hypothetical protein
LRGVSTVHLRPGPDNLGGAPARSQPGIASIGRVRRRRLIAPILAGLLALALAVGSGSAAPRAKPKLVVGKENLVAPLRIPARPRTGPVPGCRRAGIHCMQRVVRRLAKLEARHGCDHRAVFATTYRVLSRELLRTLREDPAYFRFPRFFYFEAALFADVYVANTNAPARGRRVSPAWQIAFETAREGDANAAQDMLLGINAHVQNDMPFVIAALNTKTPGGVSRKPDHDKENEVLAAAYQRVVDAVERRYDPSVGATNPDGVPVDDVAGLEIVKRWRQEVWRNAGRLIATRKRPAAHAAVVEDIEENAANWAEAIASGEAPGYRASRDAYCAGHNPDA